MQNWMFHYCDETMFFSYVLFIQMHMVINISLGLLIKIWISTNNFIMNIIMWLFINLKTHLLIVMDFWSPKYGLVV